jgi:hypothetical protein
MSTYDVVTTFQYKVKTLHAVLIIVFIVSVAVQTRDDDDSLLLYFPSSFLPGVYIFLLFQKDLIAAFTDKTVLGQDQRHNQPVQAQCFGENEDQNHTDE